MSFTDRRTVLLGLIALGACGFAPAYGPGGAGAVLFGDVAFDPPSDKNAFDLVERFEELLGRPDTPARSLSYRITTQETGVAITPENATTRYNVTGTIAYTMTGPEGAADDAAEVSGQVTSFTSYSATGTAVATNSSREDAYLRLMRLLADQIVTRLIAAS